MRFEQIGKMWDEETGDFVSTRHVSLFDGSLARSYFEHLEGERSIPKSGFIHKENRNPEATGYVNFPVLAYCRPLSGMPFPDPTNGWKLKIRAERQLLATRSSGSLEESLVLESSRFVVLNSQPTMRGLPYSETTIDYGEPLGENVPHDLEAEFPKAWRIVRYAPTGNLRTAIDATLASCRLNTEIADEVFSEPFPAGIMVCDMRNSTFFISRKDGNTRPIERDELGRGATYDELVATETGMARTLSNSSLGGWVWALVIGAALLMFGSVAYFLRKGRRNRV